MSGRLLYLDLLTLHTFRLKVVYIDNHPKDFNPSIYEVFDDCAHSPMMKGMHLNVNEDSPAINEVYVNEWNDETALVERYNGYRFAFGQRLHAFLPFMAFSTPSIFLTGSPIRQTMPYDYFKDNIFLSKVSYSSDRLESLVNTMIVTLEVLIQKEARIVNQIEDNIASLWETTVNNKNELLANCN